METILSESPVIHLERIGNLTTDMPDTELLRQLKQGDDLSLYKFYQTYAGSLLGIIVKFIKYDDIAEDLLQETFVKIWKSLDKYDPEKGRIFTWMARIARNTAIDYLRGQSCAKILKTTDLDIAYVTVDKSNHVSYNTDTIGIKELINVLPHAQKQILDLVYFQGYTQLEVSDRLQIPLGSVKSKIRYAILVLRTHFN